MSVTTTKTRHSSQIALARFADDLERLQLQQLFQLLQQKKESLPQRKGPSSIPIQEKRGCRDAGIPGAMFPRISMKVCHFHVHIDHCDSASQRRDRAEGATSACERCGYLEGGQVVRDWDWHSAAHLKGASMKRSTPRPRWGGRAKFED